MAYGLWIIFTFRPQAISDKTVGAVLVLGITEPASPRKDGL